jgi:hypothetical protein
MRKPRYRIRNLAGIDDVRIHNLRHSAPRLLVVLVLRNAPLYNRTALNIAWGGHEEYCVAGNRGSSAVT